MFERLSGNYKFAVIFIITLSFVFIVYWPVLHADFVWDDVVDFRDKAWLRTGDEWTHYIFKDFNYWTNYFRPVGVALFTLQVRLFHGEPGPMHFFSLALHLINTFLVGITSLLFFNHFFSNPQAILKRTYFVAGSMLLYGLHPVLVEPIAWIGSQFDLIVTMLLLFSLVARLCINKIFYRAGIIAFLFFMAACTKESAVSFPLILVVFDWLLVDKAPNQKVQSIVRALLRKNWPTYLCIFIAGLGYLAFRQWALGKIVDPFPPSPLSAFARLQEVCFLYLHYWKTLLFPGTGMSPIHPFDLSQFNRLSLQSSLTDIAAIGLFLAGSYFSIRRSSVFGSMILVVTVALLPVLHIASSNFDSSLYHERYAITALATVCPMIPLAFMGIPSSGLLRKPAMPLLALVCLFWLVAAVITIRSTLPLWFNNVNLWQWALVENPGSVEAKDSLLSAYIDSKDYSNAHKLITKLVAEQADCANCMLNAAILDIHENNPSDASKVLDQVRNSKEILVDKKMFGAYLLATGQMLILQGKLDDAVGALGDARDADPLDPQPRISLAIALALQGKVNEANKAGDEGIRMLPSNERDVQRAALNDAISSRSNSTSRVNP